MKRRFVEKELRKLEELAVLELELEKVKRTAKGKDFFRTSVQMEYLNNAQYQIMERLAI